MVVGRDRTGRDATAAFRVHPPSPVGLIPSDCLTFLLSFPLSTSPGHGPLPAPEPGAPVPLRRSPGVDVSFLYFFYI